MRWDEGRTFFLTLVLTLLSVGFACFSIQGQGLGLATRDGCEDCHTDKIALKHSLDPFSPKSPEEGEES